MSLDRDIQKRMKDLNKGQRKVEKKHKKFSFGDYAVYTKMNPYEREKISLRDIDDMVEDGDVE